jgi:DNA-binding XRE family transcriptional regulator
LGIALDAYSSKAIIWACGKWKSATHLNAGRPDLMAHRPFKELQEKMSPESRARAEAMAKKMMAEMLLAEIRKFMGLTQEELASALGVTQPSLSKLENQDDMQISTLRRVIEALGGQLEIIAHLPGGDIRIRQFKEAS